MDEYSEVMISMTCAVYSSRIIPEQALQAMEGERLEVVIPQLISFGETEIADVARKSDHAAIDVACGRNLLKFVKEVSAYLPDQIAKISIYLYEMWYGYLSHELKDADLLRYSKEEFSRHVVSKISEMGSKLSAKDKEAVRMLSNFVLYRQEMHVLDPHGLFALIDLLSRKTGETERLSHVLHITLIREEIWKKNLFAG